MRPIDIDHFFTLLSKRVRFSVRVILTGGGAGILEGVSRATRDLDFQLSLKKKSISHSQAFRKPLKPSQKKPALPRSTTHQLKAGLLFRGLSLIPSPGCTGTLEVWKFGFWILYGGRSVN